MQEIAEVSAFNLQSPLFSIFVSEIVCQSRERMSQTTTEIVFKCCSVKHQIITFTLHITLQEAQ